MERFIYVSIVAVLKSIVLEANPTLSTKQVEHLVQKYVMAAVNRGVYVQP